MKHLTKKNATLDPKLAKHPQGLGLADDDKKALVAFLKGLSDPKFVSEDCGFPLT